jgi:transcriptional regulator with XRE-family HTH domain
MADSGFLLAPKHVRAARALLAWKQADLARAASVATSTIADFERGQRTPVANNATAIREALEAQGLQFLPGGVVVSSQMPAPVIPKPGRPMRWIEAHDLAQWGVTRDGQAKLPELISRLILGVYGPAAMLRFPSSDSIQHAGDPLPRPSVRMLVHSGRIYPDSANSTRIRAVWEGPNPTAPARRCNGFRPSRPCIPM